MRGSQVESLNSTSTYPNSFFGIVRASRLFFCSRRSIHSSDIGMNSEMFHLEWDHFHESLTSSIEDRRAVCKHWGFNEGQSQEESYSRLQ